MKRRAQTVTPQQAADELLKRRRARDSFLGFAQYMQPADQQPARHHQLLCNELDAIARGECDSLMICMPPGSAKALALDTPIPTPEGWRTMGELRVGDQVFGDDGRPCRVTWVSPIWRDRPAFSVRTDCGDEIIADRDHEWLVRLCGKRQVFKIKETHQLARSRSKRPMIRRAARLYLPEAALPIEPYLLGVWLGDGSSSGVRITSSVDDQPWLRAELERLGFQTRDSSVPTLFGVLGVRAKFAALGLLNDPTHATYGRKHIPPVYLRASAEQRLALLQGLIDTDGTICKKRGCATFCNTNRELAEGVRELVRSLGVKAGWSESPAMLNGKHCGTAYRVSFYLREAARMPRKAARCRDQQRTPDTYIDVQPADTTDTVCIEVDSPSHLFLCGRSMTPTHNSTFTSVLFPPYLLGRHPESLVIAGSHTLDLVEGFGRRARNLVADAPYRAVFPESRLADDSQAAGRWSLMQGGGYYACGVGGSVTGRRGDYVLVDDPVASREDADSPRMRERTWDWWVHDVMPRLRPGGRRVITLTRWHEDDLAGRLLDREAGRWRVIRLPMLAGQNDPLGRAPGEMLWPEWFTPKMVEDAQRDARAWTSLYQQDPRPPEGAEMKRSWLCRYDDWPPTANRVLLVDPSGGKKRGGKPSGDYTSMWVVALGADGNAYIVDGIRARLNLAERINALFELHRKWKPLQTRYEEYGMQADIEAARAEMERRQYRFRIYPVGGAVSKEDRIRRLIPWFEGGRIWFPRDMIRSDERGVSRDIIEDVIQQEYLPFPVGRYDDALDNLARLAEPATAELPGLPWPKAGTQQEQAPNAAWAVIDDLMGY